MRISRSQAIVTFVVAGVLIGILGCSLGSKTTTQSPLPATCSSVSQEIPVAQFVFNTDYKRREEIVGMSIEWGKDDVGGIVWLDGLSLSAAARLYEEGFVDPNDRQNLAPTSREILLFMCKHPSALVSGYMVSPMRDDYRVTFDAVEVPRRDATLAVRQEFEELCKDSDELVTDGDLYCWWD